MTLSTSNSLTLAPHARYGGVVRLPGSKSLSNRILLMAALSQSETLVENLLNSEDTVVMVAALKKLGVGIEGDLKTGNLKVTGQGGPLGNVMGNGLQEETDLFLGNAGTAMRPLTAVLAGGKGTYLLNGVPRMHERPIGDLVEGLTQLTGQTGGKIEFLGTPGFPPLRLHAEGLAGGEASISGKTSSQFLTALLMAAPLAQSPVTVTIHDKLVSVPYVRMTLTLMTRFGITWENHDDMRFVVPAPQTYRSPGRAHVEGDASSASYFLAAAAISNGAVRVEGCGTESLQGDAKFAQVLEKMGAEIKWEAEAIEARGGKPLQGVEADLTDMPDAAMTLAVAALFAKGPTTLKGIANWRVKETDRMAAVSTELEKLGARTEVGEDHLVVHPPETIQPASIATYDDHRMAMAFSLAACGPAEIIIQDPACVAKTFPDYFSVLENLRQKEARP